MWMARAKLRVIGKGKGIQIMEARIPKTFGHMNLTGAGLGAVGPVTVRGARLLGEAEIVLHDVPVSPEVS